MANYSTFVRRPWVAGGIGFGRATMYQRIQLGLFPAPVKIGRMSVWIDRELTAVNEAIVAGVSDDELRQVVAELVRQRKGAQA